MHECNGQCCRCLGIPMNGLAGHPCPPFGVDNDAPLAVSVRSLRLKEKKSFVEVESAFRRSVGSSPFLVHVRGGERQRMGQAKR